MNRRSKSVVLVVAALPPPTHGQSAITKGIVDALRSSGSQIELVDTSPRRLERSFIYHFVRTTSLICAVLKATSLRSAGRKCLYTVVESGFGILYNLVLVAICRVMKFEIYLHHHTARYCRQKRQSIGILARLAGVHATHIVLSDLMGRDLMLLYPSVRKISICHNLVEFRAASTKAGPAGKALKVGLLSNLCKEKGLNAAIEICKSANDQGIATELVLAGPAFGKEAQSLIEASSHLYADWLSYRGPVYGNDKERYFDELDVFIFPTQYAHEAQPLVLIEAMSFSLPIIASDIGYIRELLGAADNLSVSQGRLLEESVEELRRLKNNREFFIEMRLTSRNRYNEIYFTAKHELSRLIDEMSS